MNILLSHGSPDEAHRQAVANLASDVAEKLGEPVTAHFLDEEILPGGACVLPAFLGGGGHVTIDVRAMAERFGWRLLPSLKESSDEVAAVLTAAAGRLGDKARAVMLAPYRFTGMQDLVASLYRHSRRLRLPAIAAVHGTPNVADVLELWLHDAVGPVAIQPALISPGKSYARIVDATRYYRDEGMEITLGVPLSGHKEFCNLLVKLFREGQ